MSLKIISCWEFSCFLLVALFAVIVLTCCDKITMDRLLGIKFSDDGKGKKLVSFHNAFGYIYATKYTIPDGVEIIGKHAFMGNRTLKQVIFSSSVTTIEECAFSCCKRLRSMELTPGVTSIGDQAFADCLSLKSVKIPDGVRHIGKETFAGCVELERVSIPPSVISIGTGAFKNCPCEAAVKQQFPDYQ